MVGEIVRYLGRFKDFVEDRLHSHLAEDDVVEWDATFVTDGGAPDDGGWRDGPGFNVYIALHRPQPWVTSWVTSFVPLDDAFDSDFMADWVGRKWVEMVTAATEVYEGDRGSEE